MNSKPQFLLIHTMRKHRTISARSTDSKVWMRRQRQLFREAIESRPTFTDAFVNLGATLASESRFAEADATLDKALQIDPITKKLRIFRR